MTDNPPTVLPTPFNPPPSRPVRFLLSPLGWPYYMLCILASLGILYLAMVPSSGEAAVAFIGATIAFGSYWFARFVVRYFCRWYYADRSRPAHHRFVLAVLFPIVLLAAMHFQLPFRVAFHFSKPALEREAQAFLANSTPTTRGSPAARTTKNIGRFTVCSEYLNPKTHAIHFVIDGSGLFDVIGIAYSPQPLPDTIVEGDNSLYEHIEGPWYLFTEF